MTQAEARCRASGKAMALAAGWAIGALGLLAAPPVLATSQAIVAVVTRISDGDTVWVQPGSSPKGANGVNTGRPLKVRLLGLDAPESCQAWGLEATAALRRKLLHRSVELRVRARDDYQRSLATLTLNGEDVGGWLVAHGHAWSAHHRDSLGPYASEERKARLLGRGLFADPRAMEPWTFRKAHGLCESAR